MVVVCAFYGSLIFCCYGSYELYLFSCASSCLLNLLSTHGVHCYCEGEKVDTLMNLISFKLKFY
uniref:Uncharacterized protein n=1 Tax=Rhizophora mucronata TaxID=61149 RepID=A0A2P2QYB2_RHIMU